MFDRVLNTPLNTETILDLYALTTKNGETHSNNSYDLFVGLALKGLAAQGSTTN